MGRDCILTLEQFAKLRGLVANAPMRTTGEAELLVPLLRKLTLTDVEKGAGQWQEITGADGRGYYAYNPQATVGRHFASRQVNALLVLIKGPPQGLEWRVHEWELQANLRRLLGETVVEPDGEEDEDAHRKSDQ